MVGFSLRGYANSLKPLHSLESRSFGFRERSLLCHENFQSLFLRARSTSPFRETSRRASFPQLCREPWNLDGSVKATCWNLTLALIYRLPKILGGATTSIPFAILFLSRSPRALTILEGGPLDVSPTSRGLTGNQTRVSGKCLGDTFLSVTSSVIGAIKLLTFMRGTRQ